LNGHGGLTGRLWEADGTRWTCHFTPAHLEQLPEAWMRTVRLVGVATLREEQERTLRVESLVVLDEELPEAPPLSQAVPFWNSLPLEELAAQQGVGPVANLDEIGAAWPADDDPDELLSHILAERAARRKVGA
jgi:hypothetical protein